MKHDRNIEDRKTRRAEALRANLKRRKAQSRQRLEASVPSPPSAAPTSPADSRKGSE